MTTSSTPKAMGLMNLAERMGIPSDEAIRQLAQLAADDRPVVVPAIRVPVGSAAN